MPRDASTSARSFSPPFRSPKLPALASARCVGRGRLLQPIERARHAARAFVHHVRVNHGGRDIAVAEELLHGTDVAPALEEMRGKRMAKRMARDGLEDTRALG